jgi:hypothetical protein
MKTRTAGTGKKITPPGKGGAVEVDPRFAPVVEAFVRDRQVSYGKMFASMGLKVNGKIFAMHVKGSSSPSSRRSASTSSYVRGRVTISIPGTGG